MIDKYSYLYITKNYKAISKEPSNDMEGIILFLDKLTDKQSQSYLKFLDKLSKFEKEYEITWNKATILKCSGEIYPAVENIHSLKYLSTDPEAVFMTANQLKAQNEYIKQYNFHKKSFSEFLNYCVDEFGWLYVVNGEDLSVVNNSVKKSKSSINKVNKVKTSSSPNKIKHKHTIKRSKTVSNAAKTKNRKKHKFLHSIGR